MFKFGLLCRCQDSELPLLFRILGICCPRSVYGCIGRREIILVVQCRQHVLLPSRPCVVMVVCDIDHVVCVDGSERSESVSNNGEESHQNTVDDMNNVNLLTADIDPADQEQHPCQTKKCDKDGVQRDQEAQRSSDVLPKTSH